MTRISRIVQFRLYQAVRTGKSRNCEQRPHWEPPFFFACIGTMNLCGEIVARASRPQVRQRGRDARATTWRFIEGPAHIGVGFGRTHLVRPRVVSRTTDHAWQSSGLTPRPAGGTMLAIAMGGVTGGATGGVAGLLFGAASSPDHGVYYSQEVARGRTLVTVTCPPDRQPESWVAAGSMR